VITVFAGKYYGNTGLIALAGLVGVVDIDPFILSLVSRTGEIQGMVVTAIIVSMMSNTLVKGIYFGFQARQVRVAALWRYSLWAALHVPVILLG
jgi:uncharacterized membrane protein YkvI